MAGDLDSRRRVCASGLFCLAAGLSLWSFRSVSFSLSNLFSCFSFAFFFLLHLPAFLFHCSCFFCWICFSFSWQCSPLRSYGLGLGDLMRKVDGRGPFPLCPSSSAIMVSHTGLRRSEPSLHRYTGFLKIMYLMVRRSKSSHQEIVRHTGATNIHLIPVCRMIRQTFGNQKPWRVTVACPFEAPVCAEGVDACCLWVWGAAEIAWQLMVVV